MTQPIIVPSPRLGPQDLDRQLRSVLQGIERDLVVPIVGAELLVVEHEGCEINLYRYIAERLAVRLDVPAEALRPDFTLGDVAAYHHARSRWPAQVYPELDDIVATECDFRPPTALLKLARITKLRLFVTTTFDSLLQSALDQVRYNGQPTTESLTFSPRDPNDLPPDWKQRSAATVFHLYGTVSSFPDEYVVTDADALEFLHAMQSQSHQLKRLLDEVNNKHLLLIGCEFADWVARFFIRVTRGQRYRDDRSGLSELFADHHSYEDAGLRTFLDAFRQATRVLPGDAISFVDRLHEKWCERHPESLDDSPLAVTPAPSTLPRPPVRGVSGPRSADVFISYSRDDREAASKLCEALSTRMSVWMDKRGGLQSGDAFADEIFESIRSCLLFVPVISRTSAERFQGFYRREWEAARLQIAERRPDAKFVVPVLVDDVEVNHRGVPSEFWRYHAESTPGGRAAPEFVERMAALVSTQRMIINSGRQT